MPILNQIILWLVHFQKKFMPWDKIVQRILVSASGFRWLLVELYWGRGRGEDFRLAFSYESKNREAQPWLFISLKDESTWKLRQSIAGAAVTEADTTAACDSRVIVAATVDANVNFECNPFHSFTSLFRWRAGNMVHAMSKILLHPIKRRKGRREGDEQERGNPRFWVLKVT